MNDIEDMGEFWRERKEANQRHRMEQLARATEKAKPDVWLKHTDYHWSRIVAGHKLDFWPSTSKFMYRGKVRLGGLKKVEKFIKEIIHAGKDR